MSFVPHQGQKVAISALCCAAAGAAGSACGWVRLPRNRQNHQLRMKKIHSFKLMVDTFLQILICLEHHKVGASDFRQMTNPPASQRKKTMTKGRKALIMVNRPRSIGLAWDLVILLASAGFAQILSLTLAT